MDVVVTTESRFFRRADRRWICQDGTFDYMFWRRYLDVFDRVIVVARGSDQSRPGDALVEGDGVMLWPLSDSRGVWGAMKQWTQWQRQMRPLVESSSAFVLRLPGQIGVALGQMLRQGHRQFGVEAVGEPADVFCADGYRHPLRPALRYYFRRTMRQLCREATAASYVTSKYLQTQYPPNSRAFTTHYSSVELPREALAGNSRDYRLRPSALHLVNVATMSQRYKGQHHLIEAVSRCVRAGRAVHLALVGDGQYRTALEQQVRWLKLTDQVRFVGRLPAGVAVWQALDQADLFVLPSLQEGLPRALIEAQARALPCLATSVGGVPELVAESECLPPARPAEMAAALISLLDDPHRLTRLSYENLQRARRYSATILRQRRASFYRQLRDAQELADDRFLRRAA
jgi:glycosyltransferase involved in cell wall biosynthesis